MLLLLLSSVYGCERVVFSPVSKSQAIAAEKVESKHQLITQFIAQERKGVEFLGLPILASSRFVIMSDKQE